MSADDYVGPLPPGWKRTLSVSKQKHYFANAATQQAVWTLAKLREVERAWFDTRATEPAEHSRADTRATEHSRADTSANEQSRADAAASVPKRQRVESFWSLFRVSDGRPAAEQAGGQEIYAITTAPAPCEAWRDEEGQASIVAQRYDAFHRRSRDERASSLSSKLGNVNNLCKRRMIDAVARSFAPSSLRVLDLACGKGGDIGKWLEYDPREYVGVDLSQRSLEEAASRFASHQRRLGKSACTCAFVHADMTTDDLTKSISSRFDVVNMQFALHYGFGCRESAHRMLSNVSSLLYVGGFFIGITTDPLVLVRGLMSRSSVFRTAHGDVRAYGNRIFSVATTADHDRRLRSMTRDVSTHFGVELAFSLSPSVYLTPEFLVTLPALRAVAESVGLEMRSVQNLHTLILSEKDPTHMLERANALSEDRLIDPLTWETAHQYMAFVFMKMK